VKWREWNWLSIGKERILNPLIGPEPDSSNSERVSKQAISGWMNRKYQEYLQSTLGEKHTKGFFQEPSEKNYETIRTEWEPVETSDKITGK
jgi:hypothetical protein